MTIFCPHCQTELDEAIKAKADKLTALHPLPEATLVRCTECHRTHLVKLGQAGITKFQNREDGISMKVYDPLHSLPMDIQRDWRAQLFNAPSHSGGVFRLVDIRRTQPHTFEEMRVKVLIIDENGFPLSGIKIAFAYSTANPFLVDETFTWSPPERKADIFPTEGSGQIEHIQGSVVRDGQAGGITCFVVEPEYASDHVVGLGALADHTGLALTFQLRRVGYTPLVEEIAEIKARLAALEGERAGG